MTFQILRQSGLAGVLDATIAEASASYQAAEKARLLLARGSVRGSMGMTDQFIAGGAVEPPAVAAVLECDAAGLRLLADACAAAAALVRANPGEVHQPDATMGQAHAAPARRW